MHVPSNSHCISYINKKKFPPPLPPPFPNKCMYNRLEKVSVFDLKTQTNKNKQNLIHIFQYNNKHIVNGICITSTEGKVNSFITYLKFEAVSQFSIVAYQFLDSKYKFMTGDLILVKKRCALELCIKMKYILHNSVTVARVKQHILI